MILPHAMSLCGQDLTSGKNGLEEPPASAGLETEVETLFNQYFSEDGYQKIENPGAILSQLELLIQKHNGLVGQESQDEVDVSKLPGISVHNPLESVIIGKNIQKRDADVSQEQGGGGGAAAAQKSVKKKRERGAVASQPTPKKPSKTSSKYRGVTQHARSGRYEAHIWVKEIQKQMYLGGYEHEEHAAEAYDIAALKSKGRTTKTNFSLDKYRELLDCIDRMTLDELVMAVRRQSQGFSRGSSAYRGVTRHPTGRWEARIGIPGSKHVYLGLYNQEAEAARVYDRALIRLRGKGAATNFSLLEYKDALMDFHKLQTKVLQGNPYFIHVTENSKSYEQWLRLGSKAFPESMFTSDSPLEDDISGLVEDDLRQFDQMAPGKTEKERSPVSDGLGPAMEAITKYRLL